MAWARNRLEGRRRARAAEPRYELEAEVTLEWYDGFFCGVSRPIVVPRHAVKSPYHSGCFRLELVAYPPSAAQQPPGLLLRSSRATFEPLDEGKHGTCSWSFARTVARELTEQDMAWARNRLKADSVLTAEPRYELEAEVTLEWYDGFFCGVSRPMMVPPGHGRARTWVPLMI